jgi:hypothetical protein
MTVTIESNAIIEAAARALEKFRQSLVFSPDAESVAKVVLATVTPLIRADVLEEAAVVAEDVDRDVAGHSTSWSVGYFAQHIQVTAAAIRALKEQNMTEATREEQLGDAPIEPEFRAMMNELAADLDTLLNPGPKAAARTTGFVLLMFPFDRKGRANYISNANRADVVTLLKEQLARFEGQEQP